MSKQRYEKSVKAFKVQNGDRYSGNKYSSHSSQDRAADEAVNRDQHEYDRLDKQQKYYKVEEARNLSNDSFQIYIKPSDGRRERNDERVKNLAKYGGDKNGVDVNYLKTREFTSRAITRTHKQGALDQSCGTYHRIPKPIPVDKFTSQLSVSLSGLEKMQYHSQLLSAYNGLTKSTIAPDFVSFIDMDYFGYDNKHAKVFRSALALSNPSTRPNQVTDKAFGLGRFVHKSIVAVPSYNILDIFINDICRKMIAKYKSNQLPTVNTDLISLLIVIVLLRCQFGAFNHRVFTATFVAYSILKFCEEIIMLAMIKSHVLHHFEVILFLVTTIWNYFNEQMLELKVLCSDSDVIANDRFCLLCGACSMRLGLLGIVTMPDIGASMLRLLTDDTNFVLEYNYTEVNELDLMAVGIKHRSKVISEILIERKWDYQDFAETIDLGFRDIHMVKSRSIVNLVSNNGKHLLRGDFKYLDSVHENIPCHVVFNVPADQAVEAAKDLADSERGRYLYIKYDSVENSYYLKRTQLSRYSVTCKKDIIKTESLTNEQLESIFPVDKQAKSAFDRFCNFEWY